MTFQVQPFEAHPRDWASADPPPSRVKGRNLKPIPDYEKPLVKTGEARLWRELNSGDRVEVIHNQKYSKSGTIDARTCDGNTVWIILDQGMGRIAVTEGDPVALIPVYQKRAAGSIT